MTGNEARRIFIDYFKKHGHQHVRSSSLVPQDDPTLLFVNAGMVQFKRVFTGDEKRNYSTAVTAQKCVRAGGKHNDLENVGFTARHHTFFEMLGNFSFGDYFKDKAIEYSWDLMTDGYGLDPEKLWVSVYQDDDEAYDLWRDLVGVPEERIVRLGEDENFWAMGDTGPCGPCSEIHIDRGLEYGCGREDCAVGCECDRFLELWNLVFMQFDRDESGNMTPLPKPSIDTGLGVERIAAVLQDVRTNFETDLFVPIMKKVESLCGKRIYDSEETEVAMKVIADHSRASAFLICDGVLPSNEGRGYVLRRIMRRAVRFGRNLGLMEPFLYKTVQTVFDIMEDAYPELKESASFIINVVQNEEKKFFETLDTGMKLLEETIASLEKSGEKVIPGSVIFKLYDTFGFPVDVVRDVVKSMDLTLDLDGFDKEMEEQRERSRRKAKFEGVSLAFKELVNQGVKTEFTGYGRTEDESVILALSRENKEVSTASRGDRVDIVVEKTPFYAMAGGQAGDTGVFETADAVIAVEDTFSDPSGLVIHKGEVEKGGISKGDSVTMKVDRQKREDTARNHTATHILHSALRSILGDHVKQAGSLVTHDRLRFDFTHFSPVSEEDMASIERRVNQRIRENHEVTTEEMSMDDAEKSGAVALFEEKYGETVRVVSQGDFSRELCGGTHVKRSGDIGSFRILSETGIASGVRRIEAVTGHMATEEGIRRHRILKELSGMVKATADDLPEKVALLSKEKKELEKQVESLKAKVAAKSADNIESEIREVGGVKVLSKRVEVENPSQLRDIADKFKAKIRSGVILLGAESNEKALLISVVTDDLKTRYKAGDIVKQAAAIVGGGGGGRPDMAQAGGPDPTKLDQALESVFQMIT
ncbi:MAG: alanine--tRNA ligase [Desulfobacteraceae bacterium]